MPISRGQMPRQMYGLGSLVKSIGKTVKKIVKSPIGKAAILGFGANALMPGGLSSLFGSGSFNPLLRKVGGDFAQSKFGSILSGAKNFLGDKLAGKAGMLGAGALAGIFASQGISSEQAEEIKRNPAALRSYLAQYYRNLNQDADEKEVNEFVEANMTEYKADGGRIGYNEGTGDPTYTGNNMEDLPRGLQMDTTTSNPMPAEKSLKENLEFVKETKGGVSPSTTMYMFKMYLDEALEKGQITKEKYNKMLMPFFGEASEGVTRDFERYEEKMANGGRMGYAEGNPDQKQMAMVEDMLKRGMDMDTIKTLTGASDEVIQDRINFIKYGGAKVPIEKAEGGRMGFAMGMDSPEKNAVQASGIMNLPLNQNPAGITELDLRETGGFIPPVGVKEKADDIPAMLSNNEFVFTADAVKGMGDGDVNKGAQRMYDMMKKLEKGGTV